MPEPRSSTARRRPMSRRRRAKPSIWLRSCMALVSAISMTIRWGGMGRSQTQVWIRLQKSGVLQGQRAEVDEHQVFGDGVAGQGVEHRAHAQQVQPDPQLGRQGEVLQQAAHRVHPPVVALKRVSISCGLGVAVLQGEDGMGIGHRLALAVQDALEHGLVHGREAASTGHSEPKHGVRGASFATLGHGSQHGPDHRGGGGAFGTGGRGIPGQGREGRGGHREPARAGRRGRGAAGGTVGAGGLGQPPALPAGRLRRGRAQPGGPARRRVPAGGGGAGHPGHRRAGAGPPRPAGARGRLHRCWPSPAPTARAPPPTSPPTCSRPRHPRHGLRQPGHPADHRHGRRQARHRLCAGVLQLPAGDGPGLPRRGRRRAQPHPRPPGPARHHGGLPGGQGADLPAPGRRRPAPHPPGRSGLRGPGAGRGPRRPVRLGLPGRARRLVRRARHPVAQGRVPASTRWCPGPSC